MQHITKSGTKWAFWVLGLLAVGIFALAESRAAVESNDKPFLSNRLITNVEANIIIYRFIPILKLLIENTK